MKVVEKYAEVIKVAKELGVTSLQLDEKDGVLFINGTAASDDVRKKLWDTVAKIDSNHRAGDLVMNIKVDGLTGDASPENKQNGYTEDVDKNK